MEDLIEVINRRQEERAASTTAEQAEPVQDSTEGKVNPVARFLRMLNAVAVAELPTIGGAAIVMSIIAILVSIKFISVEFMVILVLGTIIKYSFQAGVVWQRVRSGKGRA